MAEKRIDGWEPKGAMEEYRGYAIWDHSDFAPDLKNDGTVDPDWKVNPGTDGTDAGANGDE